MGLLWWRDWEADLEWKRSPLPTRDLLFLGLPSAHRLPSSPLAGSPAPDLLAVLPMLHERHLPVTAPAHDPHVAVASLGHVPGRGPQSGSGGSCAEGSGRPRSCPAGGEVLHRRGPVGPGASRPGPPGRRYHSNTGGVALRMLRTGSPTIEPT